MTGHSRKSHEIATIQQQKAVVQKRELKLLNPTKIAKHCAMK